MGNISEQHRRTPPDDSRAEKTADTATAETTGKACDGDKTYHADASNNIDKTGNKTVGKTRRGGEQARDEQSRGDGKACGGKQSGDARDAQTRRRKKADRTRREKARNG